MNPTLREHLEDALKVEIIERDAESAYLIATMDLEFTGNPEWASASAAMHKMVSKKSYRERLKEDFYIMKSESRQISESDLSEEIEKYLKSKDYSQIPGLPFSTLPIYQRDNDRNCLMINITDAPDRFYISINNLKL